MKLAQASSAVQRPTVPSETQEFTETAGVVATLNPNVRTLDELLAYMKVDLDVWEVEKHTINKWETVMREPATTVHVAEADPNFRNQWVRKSSKPLHEPLFQVKAWLKKRGPRERALTSLLQAIETKAPLLPVPPVRRLRVAPRSLELSVMDPHIGLLCAPPEADAPWDLDMAASTILGAMDDLIEKALVFGPFEEAFMPFGNDFVHADTVFHETTAGTGQPEAIAWHRVYDHAERIAIQMVQRLRQVARVVHVYEIPGNHSRLADFTLARLVRAYFRNDAGVRVDASSSPYKFHRYGVNLIGYEHGHSVSSIRLAALMANERPHDWAETRDGYREWHLGDQHRKGSSKPSAMEEQGVSVEYIPGLTAPNEWHRLKAFNHQKRGAMAFVWDKTAGPVARLQFNIGPHTHQPLKSAVKPNKRKRSRKPHLP